MAFNASEHLMKLQGKDYLEVKWRLVWFREKFPNGSIETDMLKLDLDRETEEEVMVWNDEKKRKEKVIKRANGFAIFKAVVKDGQGGVGTGTKSEKAASFPDYIEKAESGSIGRALAALGFGTQFTGDELAEHHRIVDAPVNREPTNGYAEPTPLNKAIIEARQHGFITGKNKPELTASLDEQIIQIFGSRIPDEELAKPHNLARFNGAIEIFIRAKKPAIA